MAVLAEMDNDLQDLVNRIVYASRQMGTSINAGETETQFLGKTGKQFQIKIDNQQLKQTETFVYLGGSITKDGSEEDIKRTV